MAVRSAGGGRLWVFEARSRPGCAHRDLGQVSSPVRRSGVIAIGSLFVLCVGFIAFCAEQYVSVMGSL